MTREQLQHKAEHMEKLRKSKLQDVQQLYQQICDDSNKLTAPSSSILPDDALTQQQLIVKERERVRKYQEKKKNEVAQMIALELGRVQREQEILNKLEKRDFERKHMQEIQRKVW